MFRTDVAPGVHLLQHGNVNCYLIEEGDALTVVDAGLPGAWAELGRAVRHLGRAPEDIRALGRVAKCWFGAFG
ncbi:MBL fold metallo-hydrolase [Brachybacterium sp. p3-SID957]|uniref:MBL fold metallo-hydrolase n=1 Tax=Brachybacterium sp. p3-SID957 TaxID=2916049 RepID=UPI00223C2FDC|nr:MBL fold metallo-hydrolase [Brachybacterium sp. p3-SID957]MCT1775556.1 MBL fold metallo-hydrolase [Brachybacterium sp. p3-SID957]